MRSFSTLFAFASIVTYGIQGVDAGATHDKLNLRAAIHRRNANAHVRKADVPSTLVKKHKQRHCRPRPSGSGSGSGSGSSTTPSQNSTATATTTHGGSSPPVSTSPTTSPPVGDSAFRLDHSHQGANFFDGWNFIDAADYTHGAVIYQSREGASSMGLAYVDQNTGRARMNVDTTQNVGGNRASVRIEDGYKFQSGTILMMDATHMPVGCGTWPAFWANQGANWPVGGEIDIIEGVHNQVDNLSSLHTTGGCSVSADAGFSGQIGNQDCTSDQGSNNGCNISNPSSNQPNNYGAGFNSNGGGVYVMQWNDSGIKMWFFTRNSIPADITGDAPNPDAWGTPYANFPSSSCSPDHFFDQTAIFDTTLCGDWAGAAWGECAASTGYGTCQDFVANKGDAFTEAYWEVNYVKYFVPK